MGLMDKDQLLQNFEGMLEVIPDIAEQYFEEYPKLIQAIEIALKSGDSEGLHRSAHALKGMVSNFRAEKIQAHAAILESMGKDGSCDGGNEVFAELKNLIEELNGEIRALIQDIAS